jgi:hypothetical protein
MSFHQANTVFGEGRMGRNYGKAKRNEQELRNT